MKIRNENGVNLPAVNVKPPLLFQRLPKVLQQAPEAIRSSRYEQIAERWWEEVMPAIVADSFADDVHASAAGRSNGWVVVRGLGDPNEWSVYQKRAWERFEKKIAASILRAERDWQKAIRDWMREAKANGRECLSLANFGFPITLAQQGKDRFTVTYGKEVNRDLDYAHAAKELGECIMHALACDGKLDNREKGER